MFRRPIQLSMQSWSWILTAAVFLLFFLAGMTTRWLSQDKGAGGAQASARPDEDSRKTQKDGHEGMSNQADSWLSSTAQNSESMVRERLADCALASFYAVHPDLRDRLPAVLEEALRVKLANLARIRIESGDGAVAARLASCLQPGERVAEVQ